MIGNDVTSLKVRTVLNNKLQYNSSLKSSDTELKAVSTSASDIGTIDREYLTYSVLHMILGSLMGPVTLRNERNRWGF